MNQDISYTKGNLGFSYRVAGLLIHDNKILVQRPYSEMEYAFPGGQVSLNETNEETLKREFKEELNIDISVNKLKLVGEVFFAHNNINWTQISLYYYISIKEIDSKFKFSGTFSGTELDEFGNPKLIFTWIPLEKIDNELIYPLETRQFLKTQTDEIIHFISQQ